MQASYTAQLTIVNGSSRGGPPLRGTRAAQIHMLARFELALVAKRKSVTSLAGSRNGPKASTSSPPAIGVTKSAGVVPNKHCARPPDALLLFPGARFVVVGIAQPAASGSACSVLRLGKHPVSWLLRQTVSGSLAAFSNATTGLAQ
jgi:hypothetical protein